MQNVEYLRNRVAQLNGASTLSNSDQKLYVYLNGKKYSYHISWVMGMVTADNDPYKVEDWDGKFC